VVEMALANLGWGYTKIRDALRTGLKIEIGRTTLREPSTAMQRERHKHKMRGRQYRCAVKGRSDL